LALPAAASAADTTTSAKTEVAAPRAKRAEQNGIVGGGLAIFLVSYLPATMIAESSAARFDQLLYVPVAGPWLDLARRPICGGAACNTEFGNRALLATDGMLQGLGVLMTIVGLFSDDSADNPQTAKVVETPARRVRVSPAEFGAGAYGVAAFGKF
jgi:hypothetical protein